MRILISGASGFIGKSLASFLSAEGHEVVPLSHSTDLEDFDVVIHLAGEPLTLARWNQVKRDKILNSRVEGTKSLSVRLRSVKNPPKLFISASAFGFYGNRGEEILTEESGQGNSFLSHVCVEWENASRELEALGVRVVHARFGLVLGPNGGIISKMLVPYKLGLGGKLGTGKQWVSWIALHDLIQAIDHIIHCDSIQGAVNMVAPNPVRQETFAKELAALLHRPAFLHLPTWLLRIIFGKTADEMLLSSARVLPKKLLASNFIFDYPFLHGAFLKALLT